MFFYEQKIVSCVHGKKKRKKEDEPLSRWPKPKIYDFPRNVISELKEIRVD